MTDSQNTVEMIPRILTDEEGTRWLIYQSIAGKLKRERIHPCRLPATECEPEPSHAAARF